MNLLKKGIFFLLAATVIVACSDDDDPVVTPPTGGDGGGDGGTTVDMSDHPLADSSWSLAAEVGALKVGPSKTDLSWWALPAEGDGNVSLRTCQTDDVFTFNADGTYSVALGDDTWLETWQGTDVVEGCGAAVAPHASGDHTWSGDADTFTLVGEGVFIALSKANNQNQLGTPDTNSIQYEFALDGDTLEVYLTGFQDGAYWYYKLSKQ